MKQSLSLKLGQNLTMTPALQQAIRMLQLSTLDLHAEIQDALESNLMLETEESSESTDTSPEQESQTNTDEKIPEDLPVDADWNDIYASAPAPRTASADEESYWEYRQANLSEATDLHAHLRWQASLQSFSDEQELAAAYLIDAIDDQGYLRDWAELQARLHSECGLDAQAAEQFLRRIQELDPPGVAARNLPECLAIQLRQLPAGTEGLADALRILEDGQLNWLTQRDRGTLVSRLGLTDEAALEQVLTLIRSLQPHPGEAFSNHESSYVVPEVFVRKERGRWQVSLNPDIAPRLRINPEYLGLINRSDKSADQTTLKDHLQEARFFLNSLKSRNETLLRVAQCIVEEQRAFLEYGEEAMKPLVLRDVAEALEVHESTVSRATANKYMQTPRGVFELKYFFSSHVATTDGGTCSATAIQAMIRRLVGAETPDKPLSDSKLADQLLGEGIRVARRTIAKYREGMDIPPSHERRQPR